VRVRLAAVDDVPALAAMRRAWTEEHVGGPVDDPAFEPAFEAWFEREHEQRVTWVGEVDGVVIGMLNLLVFTRMPSPRRAGATPRAAQWGYVANVYVDPVHRDRGAGSALLSAAVDHADGHGFARLVLSPSERSVPVYERAGFAPATSLMLRPGH
jgi:GNAT superfamily N-acetyltransferase